MCKAGFAGDDAPRCVFPSVVGKTSNHNSTLFGLGSKLFYVGDEVFSKIGTFWANHPIERGMVTDWDHMEQVWQHIFHNELRVSPEEQFVMLTECPSHGTVNREKTTQIMFETFSVPSLYLENQAVLSLLATGRVNGMMLESGGCVSHAVPICDGRALRHAMTILDFGGEELTDYCKQILLERHVKSDYNMVNYAETRTGRCYLERGGKPINVYERSINDDIKKACCYVALDYDNEINIAAAESSSIEKSYELPDGEMIVVGSERFRCPEVLFQPQLMDMQVGGIHELVVESIGKCDIVLRRELYHNIVLSGGNTMFEGIVKRMEKEISQLAPTSMKIKVTAQPDRQYGAWIGGSVYASMDSAQEQCISRWEYEEYGPVIAQRKLFF